MPTDGSLTARLHFDTEGFHEFLRGYVEALAIVDRITDIPTEVVLRVAAWELKREHAPRFAGVEVPA